MELLLKLECPGCRKSFIVDDADIDVEELCCPHCREDLAVPEEDD